MSVWFDTQTRALLQQMPPEKLAPPDTGTFSLVLLDKGKNVARLMQSLTRVPGVSRAKATDLVTHACPIAVADQLSIADAMLGQFELVCSDSVSVFLCDEVISSAGPYYLSDLYSQLRASSEFETVQVNLAGLPESDLGLRFIEQFIGDSEDSTLSSLKDYRYSGMMMNKKARLMAYWARKIGAEVTVGSEP